jgi:V/A-type H+-transporting ATPase subunit I
VARPVEMQFIRIIGPNTKLKQTIDALYDLKMFHFCDFKKTEEDFLDVGKIFEEMESYSEQLEKVRSMISNFNIVGKPNQLENIEDAKKRFLQIEKEYRTLNEETEKLKAEKTKLNNIINRPLAILNLKEKDLIEISKGPSKKLKGIKDKKLDLKKSLDSLISKKSPDSLIKENSNFLLDYEFTLCQLKEKAESPLKFGSTEHAFIASGWIPKDKLKVFESKILDATGNKVEIEALDTELEPPTCLQNVKHTKPFEFLLNLYSLPKSNEIDPTFVMSITFPMFFGFMLGDVGYGIFLLVMSLFIGKKMKVLQPLMPMVFFSSIFSIIFGFVFGEFFGYEFINPMLNRIHGMYQMLGVTIVIGLIHITLGYVLSFFNELKKHGLLHALLAKGGWFVLEAGGIIIAYSYLYKVPSFQPLGIGIMVVAVAMLFKGEGSRGLIEIPSLASNMLSYARLYAIGLASALLAVIINDNISPLIKAGGINLVLAIPILAMGHFINILIGVLGMFLQAARLHYVEFFTKFFEGGGKEYKPFGLKSRR